ncbi:MAG: zinc ribbon domain-containing protein [Clostridiales bacterium]|nr:zinc ribbon domain-containing protein [Clostridiales bacterium]
MFCSKCGTQVPDGSVSCSNCGAPLSAPNAAPAAAPVAPAPAPVAPAPAPVQPVQQAPAAPVAVAPVAVAPVAAAPKAPSNIDLDVGGFFKDFFANPIDAVLSRAKPSGWLLGLICAGCFALLEFILTIINYKTKVAQHAFCEFFVVIAYLAALMGILTLFTRLFGLKPLSFLSSIALVGLARMPMIAMRLLAFINTKIYIAMDINFFSISSIFTQIATIFMILCIYEYALNNKENKSKVTCLWFTLASMAAFYFADSFASWMFYKLFL